MSRSGIVLYDFLQVCGGAERVTVTLAKNLRNVDLCVGSKEVGIETLLDLNGLTLIDLGARGRAAPIRALNTMRAFRAQTCFLKQYDWVLYSGSYAPTAISNHERGRNLYYCHTIPRFIYDLKEYYLQSLPVWQRPFFKALIAYVQPRFEAAVRDMDGIIANSEAVRGRIRHYLGRDAAIIHPPCDVGSYQWCGQDDYYLSTARLEPYKRVNLAVEAFRRLPHKKLIVTSGGSDALRLRRLAAGASNITFVGWLDDAAVQELMGRAVATVYLPMDEDFGISAVESMAAGKPVIGVAEGGLLTTIVHEETGLLVRSPPTIDDVIAAVESLSPARAAQMRGACEARAACFTKDMFIGKMRDVLCS